MRGVEYFQAGHASSILVTRSIAKALVGAFFMTADLLPGMPRRGPRATHGPQRDRFPLDQLLERVGDLAVPLTRRVLVDQGGAQAAVAHSVHQLASAGAARRRQIVAGMAEIMEVESSRQAGLDNDLAPLHRPVEVVAP